MPAASRLWNPGRQPWLKPQGALGVDWSHPLAYGLRMCYPMHEGAGLARNLVRGGESISLGAGATWSRNAYFGPTLNFNNSLTGRAVLSTGFTPAATVFSVEMAVRVTTSVAANNFEYLFGSQSAGGNGCLLSNGAGVNGWDLDTTTGDLQVGAQPSLNIWYHLVYVYVSSSSATIYENAISVASGALAGSFTFPLGWMGADGTNTTNNFGGDIAWLRVWDRALNAVDVKSLYADPWEMLVSGREEATLFAVLGSLTGGTIVSGSATIISNSALVETSAQVVDPTAAVQSNSALVETAAQILSAGALVSNSALVASAQIVAFNQALVANSALVASAQVVSLGPDVTQANEVLSVPTAQVVDPTAQLISNSVLIGNGGLAGQSTATLVSNSALLVTGSQIVAPAALVSNSALAASALIKASSAPLVANAAIAQSARLVAPSAPVVSNSVLSGVGTIFSPGAIVVGHVALGDTAAMNVTLADAAAQTVVLADSAIALVILKDSAV